MWDDFGGTPETVNWDQIFGGNEGPTGGASFEVPRMQAPSFNWDDPEYGGFQGQGGFGGVSGMQGAQADAPYGQNPGDESGGPKFVNEPGPQVGQPSGSSAQTEDESLWKKFRGGLDKTATALKPETPGTKMLAGLGMAVGPGLLDAGIKGFQSMGSSKPKSPQAAPEGRAYQSPAPEPLPGTKSSPLLSGGPQKTTISQGLEERMRRGGNTGGFSLY